MSRNTLKTFCISLALFLATALSAGAAEESFNPVTGVAGQQVGNGQGQTNGEIEQVSQPRKAAAAETVREPLPNQKMTVRQVQEILRGSRDLSGRNMSGLSLIGLNMSRANLKGADLSKANLERVDFTESNLERVDFRGANLRMASFFQSAVTAADIGQANLEGAIWVDKQVCAPGSVGSCHEKKGAAPARQQSQPAAPQPQQPQQPQPAQTQTQPASAR